LRGILLGLLCPKTPLVSGTILGDGYIFVEPLWRTVKYEDIRLKEYAMASDLTAGPDEYFKIYNCERPPQNSRFQVPVDVHHVVDVPIYYDPVIHLGFVDLRP
jgi:hypothetical protein